MIDLFFVGVLGFVLMSVVFWGIRTLPGETWQMLATIPSGRNSYGSWRGINLTYYGFFTATAHVLSVLIFLVLAGSIALSLGVSLVFVAAILGICIPASKVMARLVEGKRHTFTVGGASFLGILLGPWIVLGLDLYKPISDARHGMVIPILSAMLIAYIFGEGFGRLSCLSFGCCYGRPIFHLPSTLHPFFERFPLIFMGCTKKAAYEGDFEGQPLAPVQAITAILFTFSALIATYMFLSGWFKSAFTMVAVVTQGWRTVSEVMRADYRGNSHFSAYQKMSLFLVPYSLLVLWFLGGLWPTAQAHVDIKMGLEVLLSPSVLFFSIVLWFVIFIYTGVSRVTGARVSFHVITENI